MCLPSLVLNRVSLCLPLFDENVSCRINTKEISVLRSVNIFVKNKKQLLYCLSKYVLHSLQFNFFKFVLTDSIIILKILFFWGSTQNYRLLNDVFKRDHSLRNGGWGKEWEREDMGGESKFPFLTFRSRN